MHDGAVCISEPAFYDGGRMFGVCTIDPCECGLASYEVTAYSGTFHQIDHDVVESGYNDTCHVPVHAACLELCGKHPGKLPPKLAENLLCVDFDLLVRLVHEYEDTCDEWCMPEMLDEILSLKADYGALQSFNWVDEEQVPASEDDGAFVYNAKCCNKVRWHHLIHQPLPLRRYPLRWV
jgi:hypothetical protein